MADLSYPGVKIGQIVGLIEAMDYFKKRTIYLSNAETTKIQPTLIQRFQTLAMTMMTTTTMTMLLRRGLLKPQRRRRLEQCQARSALLFFTPLTGKR